MGEEPRLAGFTEEPVLILPPFARDLVLTVRAVGRQFHVKTPLKICPETSSLDNLFIAKALPEHVKCLITISYANNCKKSHHLMGKLFPI